MQIRQMPAVVSVGWVKVVTHSVFNPPSLAEEEEEGSFCVDLGTETQKNN
jgi:hypothetical protein